MRSRRFTLVLGTSLVAAAMLAAASTGRADAVEDFYKGRAMDLVISSTSGGGYDTISRVLARHMPAHIPGNPRMTPKNMPGAGGIKVANYLASEAARDGSMFASIQNPVPFQPLLGVPQAMYDARKFSWIGSANTEIGLLFVWHTSTVTSIDDLMTRQITVAGTGGGSSTDFYYRLLADFVGLKLRSITGYPGSTESFLALERGEVEGFFLFWSTMKSSYAQRLEKKEIRNVAQFSLEKSPELPDVPFANDYIKDAKNKQAFEFAVGPLAMGRPYVAPEGVPADRLKTLRTAFLATLNDPQFVAEAQKLKLDLSGIKSGEEVAALVDRLYATPKDVVAKVAEITKGM